MIAEFESDLIRMTTEDPWIVPARVDRVIGRALTKALMGPARDVDAESSFGVTMDDQDLEEEADNGARDGADGASASG
jgi:hypothetical protein